MCIFWYIPKSSQLPWGNWPSQPESSACARFSKRQGTLVLQGRPGRQRGPQRMTSLTRVTIGIPILSGDLVVFGTPNRDSYESPKNLKTIVWFAQGIFSTNWCRLVQDFPSIHCMAPRDLTFRNYQMKTARANDHSDLKWLKSRTNFFWTWSNLPLYN